VVLAVHGGGVCIQQEMRGVQGDLHIHSSRLCGRGEPLQGGGTEDAAEGLCVEVEAAGEGREELVGVEGDAGSGAGGADAGDGQDL